jgi:hypothetical protein
MMMIVAAVLGGWSWSGELGTIMDEEKTLVYFYRFPVPLIYLTKIFKMAARVGLCFISTVTVRAFFYNRSGVTKQSRDCKLKLQTTTTQPACSIPRRTPWPNKCHWSRLARAREILLRTLRVTHCCLTGESNNSCGGGLFEASPLEESDKRTPRES